MNSESNGQTEFKVVMVGTVKPDLERFHEELMKQGKGEVFLQVLRNLNDRLRKDPRGFGERLYRLPALKLVVYQAIMIPLVVTYGVHDDLPIVFVNVAKLLSNTT
ncbi:MAG: hypothetical protein HYX68_06555 [Planctomycetes bacterium]|nr:hypothetical protein [Planctomycetota bacterium]